MKWSNAGNKGYYDNLTLSVFVERVKKGGLASCIDADEIYPYVENKHDILDVGAGYGRVANYLYERNNLFNIDVLERSQIFCHELKKKKHLSVIEKDLTEFVTNKKYDVILCMMGGISDFAPHEQPIIIQKLINLLKTDGILIIESFNPTTIPLSVTKISDQEYYEEINRSFPFYFYLPSLSEIKKYIEKAGGKILNQFDYKTSTNRVRSLSIASKGKIK